MVQSNSFMEKAIQNLLDPILANNEAAKTIAGLELLLKLITNVINKPTEEKFKTINPGNERIKNTIFAL